MAGRKGFTLIEVVMALSLLAVVILGMAASTTQFVRVVADSDRQAAAIQLADDRLQMVLMDPDYHGLDTLYAGTETGFPTLAGFSRVTSIVREGGAADSVDHKRILVTVTGPGLVSPVARTATVAAP